MSATIYVEGGGSKAVDRDCRTGFKRLWEKCGFQGRLPRMFPCGSRNSAYEQFKNHVSGSDGQDFIGLLVDSEDRVVDINRPWDHLSRRDGWSKPTVVNDDQAMLMTTSMETWIVADRDALREKYGSQLRENVLPTHDDGYLENRSRQDVFQKLRNATNNGYDKGAKSFEVLGKLNPDTLEQHLPSFRRARHILNEKLR